MKTEVGKLQDLLLARLQDLSKLELWRGMVDQESLSNCLNPSSRSATLILLVAILEQDTRKSRGVAVHLQTKQIQQLKQCIIPHLLSIDFCYVTNDVLEW